MEESKVYLQNGQSGDWVEASLFDEITPHHLALWDQGWVREMRAYCAGRPLGDRPEDSHWDWRRKAADTAGLLSYHQFSLIQGGELQGLMLCQDLKSSKLPGQFGKPMVYVEFIATAPWNRPEFESPPRFKGTGRILLLAAIEVSKATGARGRIGLHSLPAAEQFYEIKCGMTRLGNDAAHQNLAYFEMTEAQADAFCKNQQIQ